MKSSRLRIAVQKSGRLNSNSLDLLARCGLKIHAKQNKLFCHGENLPIDVLFVRDDDIPNLVIDDVCDLGIVGENILFEKTPSYDCDQQEARYSDTKRASSLQDAKPTLSSRDGSRAIAFRDVKPTLSSREGSGDPASRDVKPTLSSRHGSRDPACRNAKYFELIKRLGFSRCRLAIALPEETSYNGHQTLHGLKIATSYPNLLQSYLDRHHITASISVISGSVEIAPRLGMADAICDLVATGQTLEEHNLKEVAEIIQSEAVLIKTQKSFSAQKQAILELLLRRMEGVIKAQESKYIMFHAPIAQLDTIKTILPGTEMPTIVPLQGTEEKVAVHAVSTEGVFWSTLEKLKQIGASSILVLPIEKMLG